MKKQNFFTIIDMDKASDYIVGRITALSDVICANNLKVLGVSWDMFELERKNSDGVSVRIIRTNTTKRRYKMFRKIIESWYGDMDLCEFDAKIQPSMVLKGCL